MSALYAITTWVINRGLGGGGQADRMGGYCERLVEAGVPLLRAAIGIDTLHPLNDARGLWWVAGEEVTENVFLRGGRPSATSEDHNKADSRRPLTRIYEFTA